jgi:LmbE family N-acetylglucosaminyl deacetylase
MSNKRLLISYAHPDDESFGNGGLIAKYVAEGVEVYYICATNGELGTIPEEMQGQYASVKELRLSELENANKVLRFNKIYLLDYKDSGMMGTEGNQDPQSLWYNSQQADTFEALVNRVADIIREVQPQVILTFNRYGGYGHPDHIAIQRATEVAFKRAGDSNYQSALPPYQPQKLYYSSLPRAMIKTMAFILRLRGYDLRKLGTNKDIDMQAVIDNMDAVHANVDLGDYLEAWDEASKAHKSQGGGGMSSRFPMWFRKIMMRKQGFTCVIPVPSNKKESDLFENVTTAPIHQGQQV